MPAFGAEVWKLIGIGSGLVAAAVLVFVTVGTPRGAFFIGWGRYLAYLTRRLRRLHVLQPASRIANAQLAATFVVMLLAALHLCPHWYVIVLLIGVLPALVIERRARERIARLDMQADAFCLALANALKSTASVGAAIETAVGLMDGPVHEELTVAVKETRVGRSLAEALEAVGPRAGSRKLGIVLAAVLIGRQVGGNLPKVLDTTATTLREMERLEGVVRQKTADGRMQMWALSLAPIIICGAIHRLDPTYFLPLTTTIVGNIATAVAIAMYVSGLVVARKVLQVDL
jgi:tight adherence protein B